MAIGELIRTGLVPEPNRGLKLYECKECNSTVEHTELRNGLACPACGANRLARAKTVDSHT